ncbi:MAG: ThuA domain-containing protein, partial [Pirellulaceae bacterium]
AASYQNNYAFDLAIVEWESLLKEFPLEDGVTREATEQPRPDPDFAPQFAQYDVVLSNLGFGAAPWPEATQESFEKYMREGGGLVVVHAANNSFGDWKAFNQMIGMGGWGGRNEKSGPYIYLDESGKTIRDTSPGSGGSHGAQHPFLVVLRDTNHPITRGLPQTWLHANDELYDRLRGPGENLSILATAFASPDKGGSGRHEPMVMTVEYGKGRVFHTPMGHADESVECAGFQTLLVRGAQWAATGQVTTEVPDDFPTAEEARTRRFQP